MRAGKNYIMTTKHENKSWQFENQTTACVVTITLKGDGEDELDQQVSMDYYQYEQLVDLIKEIESI